MNNDRITELYNGEIGPPESHRRARARIHWLCAAAEGEVLDVGCSQGIASILLAREGHRVTGVDVEQAALAYARRELEQEEPQIAERLTFAFATGADLPFADASFDTVLMGELLEHLVDPRAVVREARRVLRDGGRLVVTFPYGILRYPDHKEPLYLEAVLDLLADAFAVEQIELVERWIGLVARLAGPDRAGMASETWAAALRTAERRLADLDAASEAQRGTLTRTQAHLDETLERRSAEHEEVVETRARQAATMRELDRAQAQLRAVEAEARQEQRARVEVERRLEESRRSLADLRDELGVARDRLVFLGDERERQERALEDADERAVSVERRLAVAEVELEDVRRRAEVNGAPRGAPVEPAAAPARTPGRAAEWLQRAREARSAGDLAQAREAFARALELRPGWENALWPALWVQARLDDPDAFAALAATLGPIERCSVADLERLGPLATRAGAHALAQAIGERLLALDPHSENGLLTTAAALWEHGREQEAAELVERGLADGDARAVRAAIGFRRHTDELDDVPELLARLPEPDVRLLGTFARVFERRGMPAVALELLDRAAAAGAAEPGLAELREQAQADMRVHDGSWAPPRARRQSRPEPGRVLHLVSHSLPHHTSGGTYRTHHTARAQLAAGLQPEVVTLLDFPWGAGVSGARALDILDGVSYHRVPDASAGDDTLAARLGRNLDALVPLVEELRPAVLHAASDYRNARLALELREVFDLPVVYEVRGFPEERRVRRPGSRARADQGAGRRELELECMAAADRIVTLAEVMKAHMVSRGIDGGKIRLVPNGVDPEALRPAPRDDALAAELGLEDAETVLGYVSTFHGYEGIQFVVRATAELIQRGRRARALLVGDGRERPALEALAEELGIADAVVFTGRVPHGDVLAYYALLDMFVVARRAEETSELVTPLKPFEAMAAERTVIVADLPALREIVTDGKTGRTFRPEDPVHLADVAEELIDDPAERQRLAAAGRAWVASERTWAANAARYRELYAELGAL